MYLYRYTSLYRVRQARNIESNTDDAYLLTLVDQASAYFNDQTNRVFVPYFDTLSAGLRNQYNPSLLLAPDDIIDLASGVNGDGSAIGAYTLLRPDRNKCWIQLDSSSWVFPTPTNYIRLTGEWGYHDHPAQAWQQVTTLTNPLTGTQTTLVQPGTSAAWYGVYFRIGAEIVYVSAVNTTTNTLTFIRGVNGTTATPHLAGAAVAVYQQVTAIESACVDMVAWLYKHRDEVNQFVRFAEGGGVKIGGIPDLILQTLKHYRKCGCRDCRC